ncbi:hypothetical protein Tco_1000447 [Tanacetum coccineum]
MKAKITLLKENPSTSQNPKTLQPKNKGLVVETFDYDEEEVSHDEQVTQVKVLLALADDELIVGKNHARNGEWIDITMRKLNHALQKQLKEEKKINEKWLTSLKKVSQCISEQIPHQKKKVLGGELFAESSSKMNENENIFVSTSTGYDQEMVLKSKDWVERLNPDSKLLNFNTKRILVPKSQAVNESLKPTETSITLESSKDSKAESIIPLPSLKNIQGASSSLEDSLNKSVSGTVTVSETEPTTPSVPTEVKNTEQESKINELTKLVQMLIDEKILKAKAKPFPPCTYYGFNDHRPDDCRNYPECEICGSYDHFISGHNHVIHIRGRVLAESS